MKLHEELTEIGHKLHELEQSVPSEKGYEELHRRFFELQTKLWELRNEVKTGVLVGGSFLAAALANIALKRPRARRRTRKKKGSAK